MALLLAAAALPVTPAFAQDIQPPAAATTPVAPPPVVRTTPDAPAPAIQMGTPSPVVQTLPPPDATPAEAPKTAVRAPAKPRAAAPAPRASAPAAQPAPAPTAEALPPAELITPAPVEPIAAAPEPEVAAPADVVAPAENDPNAGAPWGWIAAGIALLAALGGLLMWRRRNAVEDDDYYEETVYEEATPHTAYVTPEPVAVAPLLAVEPEPVPVIDDVSVTNSDSAEVDAIMAASAPEAGRPWLELVLRPVRAGTSEDDAIVEFELTVGNSGNVSAEDVHVSTWMFTADPAQSENEQLMIERPIDSALTDLSIEPGDGKQVNAAIALPKSGLHVVSSDGHAAFVPVVSAEARYRLPDGGEGRIAASFSIGLTQGEGEALAPFVMDGAPDMSENIEARLYGEPVRV